MDEQALERARQRIAEATAARYDAVRLDGALERARAQVEALGTAASELETTLPDRLGEAVRDGLRREVVPVARNLAEIRGLLNNAIRRLERLEQELVAERHARLGDLELLVDLLSSGWRGVDERLQRLERPLGEIVPLRAGAHVGGGEPDEPEAPPAAAAGLRG
jgi:chromosome segregation ATPase